MIIQSIELLYESSKNLNASIEVYNAINEGCGRILIMFQFMSKAGHW